MNSLSVRSSVAVMLAVCGTCMAQQRADLNRALANAGEAARARTLLEQNPGQARDNGSVLVRFRPDAARSAKAAARAAVGGSTISEFTLVPGLEHLRVLAGVDQALAALAHNPNVLYAEADNVCQATVMPNDPQAGSQWALGSLRASQAWDVTQGSSTVLVAVIDTGTNYNHPDLAANMWVNTREVAGNGIDDDGNGYVDDVRGWDYYMNDNDPMPDDWHGTHTAGSIAAVGNNGVGVAGVAYRSRIMPLRFIGPNGGYTSAAVRALQYAVANGARVSNNSWGSSFANQSLRDAIAAAGAQGHLFIAAAGNNGQNSDSAPFYPAAYDVPNIIAVAAITSSESLASFSNYGSTSGRRGRPS
jgi:subtilisin family serine protease